MPDNLATVYLNVALAGRDKLVADGAGAADALGGHLKRLAEVASRSVGQVAGVFGDANAAIQKMAGGALGGVQGLEQGPQAAGRAMQRLAGDTAGVAKVLQADLKGQGFEALGGIVGKAGAAAEAFGKLGAGGAAGLAKLGEALTAVAKSASDNFAGMGKALGGLTGAMAGAGQGGAPATGGGGALAKLAAPVTVPVKLLATGAMDMLGKLTEGLKKVGEAATVPFVIASAAIGGWVRAGLSGTTMGERLGLQFSLLSREIASLFIPVLEMVIGALQRVTDWFRSLSGETQALIGWTATAVVGLLGVATILPRIIGGISAMGNVLSVLAANPIVAIVGAIAALLVGTEAGRGALGRLAEAFAPILSAVGRLFGALKPVFDLIGQAVSALADGIASVVGKVADAVESVGDFLGNTGRAVGEGVLGGQAGPREGSNRQELANAGGKKEGLSAAFDRFQSAALRTSTSQPPTQAQMQTVIQLMQQQLNIQAQPEPAAVN